MLAIFALGGGEIFILLFLLPFLALTFAFWLWMLIDCIRNENISSNEKIAWVVAIALTHWLGALVYFFAGRNKNKPITPAPPA